MSDDVKVLIVDDSAFMRNLVGKIVEGAVELTVAGKAMNGKFALAKIETLQPDVIVLDLEMPEMNGIEFLKERRMRGIMIPVIILSSLAAKGARITMEALSLGAADFVQKPTDVHRTELTSIADTLVQLISAYGIRYRDQKLHGKSVRTTPAPSKPIVSNINPMARRNVTNQVDVVAIGISTGGPAALRYVFSKIDPELNVPVLVVQHMPAGFTREFASSLDGICPLNVKEAEAGDVLSAGRVFIAPGSHHMTVVRRRLANIIQLTDDEPVNGHRPSVDVTFKSLTGVFDNKILALIMTGMGKDGALGIGEIYHAGGITVGQDSESSVVYGMPRVAFENGVIDSVVPLKDMAEQINKIVASNR
ncbi:MAG: chemotaxis response regulator protein-glutamate methylesterase [Spirochaetales bacterium]|jgi:two-component system, chemotaxis family, protein-glutamate methylesterase/glutaminase|nr:chemotaxis response regulator protein-glutamate methylesterase [Spirochaetales bacterium]